MDKRSLWREPLLHFLVVGAALFAVREWTRETPAPPIVVDEAFTRGLERQHVQQTGRPAEDVELLVDQHVRDEVLFREALRLGLEGDDPIVRRRLVQKMELLISAAAEPEAPTEEELQRYLEAHAEELARPGRVGFEQVVFTADRRDDPMADATAALANGMDGEPRGDAFPLGRTERGTERELSGRYGDAFASAVFAIEGDEWAGPFESQLGVHLVRVTDREAGRAPSLDEVRSRVERAWRREAREARVHEAIERLVDRAEVIRP